MSTTFTADKVFEIAERIEREAADFYREAAGRFSEVETQKMLLDMAATEQEHLETFEQMRRKFGAAKEMVTSDCDCEFPIYLQTLAETPCWEGKVNGK